MFYFFLLIFCLYSSAVAADQQHQDLFFSLSATSTWREFKQLPKQNLEKKIFIGEIKLRSKDTVYVDQLTARWCGENLGSVTASLYGKKITESQLPLPIEDNLICDGHWKKGNKEIVFPVQKKLVASDSYYLMVLLPTKMEGKLRNGFFEIIQQDKRALISFRKT